MKSVPNWCNVFTLNLNRGILYPLVNPFEAPGELFWPSQAEPPPPEQAALD